MIFLASFLVLFLEVALIRWMPSYIRLLSFFSNFILLASFLGIGVGCLLASSRRRLFYLFPILQLLVIGAVLAGRIELAVPSSTSIYFSSGTSDAVRLVESTLLLPLLFVAVAALFVALAQRMARHGWTTQGSPQEGADHESEEGQEAPLRNGARPSSESEAGLKPAPDGSLRNPKEDRTVRMDRINQVRTVPRARALQNLRLPEGFLRLKDEQQAGALVALQQVDEAQRQAVLDEWGYDLRDPLYMGTVGGAAFIASCLMQLPAAGMKRSKNRRFTKSSTG